MREVAIIGAGELGGAIAHAIARAEIAPMVRLVDETAHVAAGKALDIMQAAPVEAFSTRLVGSTDPLDAGGADLVVIADRADGAGEWRGDEALALLRRVAPAPDAAVVCAGAGQRDLIERAVRDLRLKRGRVVGSAPEALAAAVRALVALETDRSPDDVALALAGVPPDLVVICWEDASVAGYAAGRVLDEPTRRRIISRLPALWPPGPFALASAAARVALGIAGRSRRSTVCFVAPDDSSGRRVRTAALPVRLRAGGLDRVVLPELNVHDRVALDNAMVL
ncbi:MAG: lactate/malate family dehydrogenase [Betaproteobacteria bacterium]